MKIPLIACFIAALCFVSCNNDSDDNKDANQPYDPNKPVEVTHFYPDSGGMATKILLEGNNFGNDPSKIKVYFNKKKAAVVQSAGDIIYAITPRQPGDTCTISVVVGSDSVAYPTTFEYTTTIGISTVVGIPGANTSTAGTLSEARIQKPQFICVDDEYNVFVSNEGAGLFLINEEANMVSKIMESGSYNAPTIDLSTGRHVLVPANSGYAYLRFSLDDGFSYRNINPVLVGNPDIGISSWSFSYKHQFASCALDGMIYFGSRTNSYVVQINPATREMKPMFNLGSLTPSLNSNYFSMFHPTEKHMLYMAARNLYCIYRFNILTNEIELFAGSRGTPGHADGDRLDARFNEVIQVDFDDDGNLFVADKGNHCIRKITPEGIVSTVIGIPGTSGYLDGTQDYAMLNTPWGVTVANDGSVYIADYGNQCVRKLSIQ
ncbi:MAG: IPT/TIG domain-containing protein [Bacteroidales bacterium]|jgi:hypothetical protein|nr:IPT/TIG domain-containing protein [Bacteroidales bacterium]